ncbi:MAG: YqgE/AlgH family protein [Thermoanaerobaculia bacterium]
MLKETAVATVLSLSAAAVCAAAGSELAPARGRFLVAERQLHDPNFSETVVLLTEYGADGAMGVIVNWPTAAPAAELVPQIEGIAELSDTVFVGGPVSRQVMLMLVRAESDLPEAERIFADVHLSTSRELLQRVIARQVETTDWRLYSGYAGWSPGQLDHELAAGGWRVLPGDPELVFAADPDEVWSELMRRGEVQWTRREPTAVARAEPQG